MANRGTSRNRTKARKDNQKVEARRALLVKVASEFGMRNADKASNQTLSSYIQMKKPGLRVAIQAARNTPDYQKKLAAIGGLEAQFLLALAGDGT